jgi:FADH2 O2-dependent halogenase
VYPTPAMMAKFMWWLNTGAPQTYRELGRTMVKGMVQSAVRGEKLL